MIIGIDEVGRGCWAGPVCVGAVALDDTSPIAGLADSKKLSAKKRAQLTPLIKQSALYVGIGWAPVEAIDKIGINGALRLAALDALRHLKGYSGPLEIILDGRENYIGDPRIQTLVDGDALVPAISAASIIAKVARDNYMTAMEACYPEYGFARHVGYGTAQHRTALMAYGPSRIHRMSFAPMKLIG
jgi:ribonuclease HII